MFGSFPSCRRRNCLVSRSAGRPWPRASRLRGATVTDGVCPYCAVGCGQLIYSKAGTLIDIEGNPSSPISEGTLCPKGANAFQLAVNPHRVTQVMYRAPYSDHWETRPLDWEALDRIALRTGKEARCRLHDPLTRRAALLNSVRTIGTLGGATLDNEENYRDQEALFGRSGSGVDRKPGRGYDTPSLGARSGASRLAAVRPPLTRKTLGTATAFCSWARTWRRPIRWASAGR